MRTHQMRLAGRTVTGHVVEAEEDLPAFADWAKQHREFGFDNETTSLDIYKPDFRIRATQFSAGAESWFIPTERHPRFAWYVEKTIRWAERLYIHNAPFDLQVVDHCLGVPLSETFPKTTDMGVLSRLVDSRARKEGGTGHTLEELVEHYIDQAAAEEIKGSVGREAKRLKMTKAKYFKTVDLDDENFQIYALMDPVLAWVGVKTLMPKVPASARGLIRYEHEIARICSEISKNGFLLDQEYTKDLAWNYRLDAEEALQLIEAEVEKLDLDPDDFNPGSNDQVADVIRMLGFDDFKKTPKGKDKVDDDLLEALASEGMDFARGIKDHRKAVKWASTWPEAFLENVDANGRCHASINTMQARTARMSITGIPAQTLPSGDWRVRRCFIADEGHIMASIDYAAQELRMAAALSGDERMKRAFENGEDLHQITADAARVSRKVGKMANFLTCYGGGWRALVSQAKVTDVVARRTIKGFNDTYPGVAELAEQLTEDARRDGYITTITGRRLYVDRARAYSAINYKIQSASRDVTANGLIKCDRAGLTPYLRLPVHDEVVGSFPKAQAHELASEVGECLRTQINGVDFLTDVEVTGRSWGAGYMTEEERALHDAK